MIVLDILFYTFIITVFIQLLFYAFIYSRFAFGKSQNYKQKNIPVSVIVCAKNEADNLEKFLPSILHQDYPEFEVVLINDGSRDHSLDIIKSFEAKYNNIKVVNVKPVEAFWGSKKYALTLGIKAASHNFLLFTDADCKPVSKHWIKQMSSRFTNTKTLVLGYGAYKKIKGSFLNKLIRFETLLTAIQYFSYTKIGLPYMAVGRNLAYRKEEFFKARGFMNHMDIKSGDDDLFVNQVASAKNTALCFSKDSFTESLPETSFRNWFQQKKRHVSTSKHYKTIHKLLLGLFYLSQLLFWILSIVLFLFLFQWKLVLALFVIRLLTAYVVLGKSSKTLNEQDLIIFFPFLELFLIVSQLFIFISNLSSKHSRWK